jgi:hypothetical protein
MHGIRQQPSGSLAIELDQPLSLCGPDVTSGLSDIEQKMPTQPATRAQRILALWPWAFLALAGLITLAWAIALYWGALAIVRWLVD